MLLSTELSEGTIAQVVLVPECHLFRETLYFKNGSFALDLISIISSFDL